MFFTIIKSSLLSSKDSKILVFLTIFLSVLLIACMLNITLKIGDEIAKELRSYGSNIVVFPSSGSLSIEIGGKEYSPLKNDDYLKENEIYKIKDIFWINNITAIAPFLSVKDGKFDIVGTYFNKNIVVNSDLNFTTGVVSLYPFWVVDGDYPSDDSLDEVLAGNKLGLKVGQIIDLGDGKIKAKVTGILHGAEDYDFKLVSSLKLAQKLSNKPNLYDKAEVSAMTIPESDLSVKARRDLSSLDAIEHDKWYCSAYVGSIAYQISESLANASAKAVLSVSEAQSAITKKIQSLMAVVSIISLIISSICITSLMSSEIYRRKKEIGLLKALGASNIMIYLQFVVEVFVVCLIASFFGALGGYACSFVIGYQIFNSFIGVSLIVLPLSVVFGLLICIFGSILPLRSVIHLLPAEVLYGRK